MQGMSAAIGVAPIRGRVRKIAAMQNEVGAEKLPTYRIFDLYLFSLCPRGSEITGNYPTEPKAEEEAKY